MRFWDSSAVIPLLLVDAGTPSALALYEEDPVLVVWWGTEVECVSALSRLEREGATDPAATAAGLARLADLRRGWHEVLPGTRVRETAVRMLRVHPLRAGDALQLAAAATAAEQRPGTLGLVCLDERLRLAAQREGFPVLPG